MLMRIFVIKSCLAILLRTNEVVLSELIFQNTTYLPKPFLYGAVGTLLALFLPGKYALFAQQNSAACVTTLKGLPNHVFANQANEL
jgi:hypothetical protein